MNILLDTNVVLLHVRDDILSKLSPDVTMAISVITEAEVLSYPGLSTADFR